MSRRLREASGGRSHINITNCSNVMVVGNIQCDSLVLGSHGVRVSHKTKTTAPKDLTDEYYKMDSHPKGLCLIIQNENFPGGDTRKGAHKDLERLEKIFKNLEFDVRVSCDLTADKMKDVMAKEAREFKADFDCLVCIIMSHGKDGQLLGTDNFYVKVNDLSSYFQPDRCKNLIDKPKIFFIQACRGENYQIGCTSYDSTITSDVKLDKDLPEEVDLAAVHAQSQLPAGIPNEKDFMFGYATVPGYRALRDENSGCWYIQALADVFEKYADSEDLNSMMTRVNAIVNKQMTTKRCGPVVQTPVYHNALTKKVIFY
ncbi:caspase-3-like [Gigantopelta aegis]|uniref:caspase-3-like n=1 Tax=Gigantopelta aegis TaxID=1735272 RepID=UPI001B88BA14|nr:caspase-3-like [Gigantopelta aegis]XP_041378267.1 caspase-3-like [Gigantopelta aegis]